MPFDMDSPILHIGKRSGVGLGRLAFIWAQDPEPIRKLHIDHPVDSLTEVVISDEYDQLYTLRDFLDMVDDCQEIRYSIGETFL